MLLGREKMLALLLAGSLVHIGRSWSFLPSAERGTHFGRRAERRGARRDERRTSRADFLRRTAAGSILSVAWICPTPSRAEGAPPFNPLGLKGQYWETGQYYKKGQSDADLPDDLPGLRADIKAAVESLRGMKDMAENGDFDALRTALRGGTVSESALFIRARAIEGLIEDEDLANASVQAFTRFSRAFDRLDEVVSEAQRQAKPDKGLVETLTLSVVSPFYAADRVSKIVASGPETSGDLRLSVLAALTDATKSLDLYMDVTKRALQHLGM
jgi:hypothetical protein